MLSSLQIRINLISIASSALIACGLIAAGGHVISEQISENMVARSRLASMELVGQLEKLTSLGLDVDDIIGFDEQCAAVVHKDGKLFFAGVYDTSGRLLFKSGSPPAGWTKYDATRKAVSEHYLVSASEARDKSGQVRANTVILVDKALVTQALRGVIRYFALIALAFVAIGLLIHFLFLRRAVVRPLAELVDAVNAVNPAHFGGALRLTHSGKGEIGSLANAFSALLQRLAEARDALVASNERLERTVEERTRQLAEANLVLQDDINRQKRLEDELRTLANTDPLTGLANRAFIMPYLGERVNMAAAHRARFAVLTFDFDGFKKINDTYGHAAGDLALRLMAQRIQAVCRQSDVLARLGGDEFLIILEGADTSADVEAFARKIQKLFELPLDLNGVPARLGVSIGAAIFPDHGQDVSGLLAAADEAMYCIKHAGGGCRMAA